MPLPEFWSHIEACRRPSDGLPAFNRRLDATLDGWELPRLAAFHKTMWEEVGVCHGDELWEAVRGVAPHVGSDNAWDSYGGWLIAQGREFHAAVMSDPRAALGRVPSSEDVWEGESVIFAAQRACGRRTDGQWGLYDLFGDDLCGGPLPGVVWPPEGSAADAVPGTSPGE